MGGPPRPPFPPAPPRPRARVWPALLLALVCLAGGATAGALAGGAMADGPGAAARSGSVSDAAAVALSSTVQIVGDDGSSGSGIVLTADGGDTGTILTNAHVVDGPREMRAILPDGTVAPLEVVGAARRADIAVVRVTGAPGLRPAQIGDSRSLRPGDTVVAVGEPLGLERSVSRGVVSATGRAFPGDSGSDVLDTIQTDAALNPGNSGGPLVDDRGRVVGVSSRSVPGDREQPAQSLGFAIPIEHATRIAGELAGTGRASLATLPATLDDVAGPGAMVTAVTPGSGADTAGLLPGNVITSFGGRPITAAKDLEAAVQSSVPGSTVEARVTGANGAARTVPIVLGSTPA